MVECNNECTDNSACSLSMIFFALGRCRSNSRVRGKDTDETQSYRRPGAQLLGRVEPKLIGLPGKALVLDATRMFRFVVHAAGWLYSMVLHGRPPLLGICYVWGDVNTTTFTCEMSVSKTDVQSK